MNPNLANAWKCLLTVLDELGDAAAAVTAARRLAEIQVADGEAWCRYAARLGEQSDEGFIEHEPGGREDTILAAVESALALDLTPESRRWALAERVLRLGRLAHGRQSMAHAAETAGLPFQVDVAETIARYLSAAEEGMREAQDDRWLAEQLEDARELAGIGERGALASGR